MENSLQIMEMSCMSKQDILKQIIKILNDSSIQQFTLLVRHQPLSTDEKRQEFHFYVQDVANQLSIRPKSSTIDKYYRTNHFLNKQRSVSICPSESDNLDDQLPDSPKDLGLQFYREGEYEKALKIFQELRQQFPLQNREQQYQKQYKDITNYLANCYFQTKNYQKAIEIYKACISECNGDVTAKQSRLHGQLYNNLGCCYGKLGYQKLSMNSYRQALAIYSKYKYIDLSPLLNNIANIYFNSAMYDIAEKYYIDAINERKSKKPDGKHLLYHAYYKLSLAQMSQEKYKESSQTLDKALKLAQNNYGDIGEILKCSAQVKERQCKWEQALQFYEKLFQLYETKGKNKGFIFQKVAIIYSNLNKYAEQKKYVNLSLEQYVKQGNQRKISELTNKSQSRFNR